MPKQRNRPVTSDDIANIQTAITSLQHARLCLRLAGAGNAHAYAGRAIKSAQGALRNAEGHESRARLLAARKTVRS
jgi:hypothetical protein